MTQLTNTGLIKAMSLSGVVLVICLVVTQGFLMGFIPPPSPALSADELAKIFIERKIGIRIGTLLQCIGYTFYLTWAMSIVMLLRKMERGLPVITYVSIANVGGGYRCSHPPVRRAHVPTANWTRRKPSSRVRDLVILRANDPEAGQPL